MIKDSIFYVNTIRYQLYEQILNPANEYVQVKDTLNYEQLTKYLVSGYKDFIL